MAHTRGIRAGRAYVELGVADRIAKGLRKAEQRLKAFGDGLRSLGTRVFAAGAAALTPLLGTVRAFSESGDTLEKMSRRTGVSVEALSELGFAAEQSGADLETLETGLRKMQKSIAAAAAGSDGAVEALARLRLTAADLANLSPEQQFKLIADRLAAIKEPTVRAALAMEIFGKSGTKLIPLLANFSRRERARALTNRNGCYAYAPKSICKERSVNVSSQGWRTLYSVIKRQARALPRPRRRFTYSDAPICAMFFWAVWYDRPQCWACRRDSCSGLFRPRRAAPW